MKTSEKRFLRNSKKWTDIFPIAMVLTAAVVIIGYFVTYLILMLTPLVHISGDFFKDFVSLMDQSGALFGDESALNFLMMYAVFIGIWLVAFFIVLVFKGNRPMICCLGKRVGGKTILSAVVGLLLGFGFNGLCVLISWLKGDIHLSFSSFQPGFFFLFLLAVTIQSGAEELAMRWYLYQKMRRRYSWPGIAIIINTVLFTLMHFFNFGITVVSILQLLVVGIFLSLLVYYYDALWTAIFFHTGWNFTQSIIFGLPNSGTVSAYSVFQMETTSARNGLFYNVDFGVEGSIGSVILLAIACVVVILINRKKQERRDLWM